MFLLVAFFLFSCYILIKNIQKPRLILLGTSLVIVSIYAISHYTVNHSGYEIIKVILYNHFTPFYLIIGPSFYFFIKLTLFNKKRLKKIHFLHLLPAIIQTFAIGAYMFWPWEEKYELVNAIYTTPANQAHEGVNSFFSPQFNHGFRLAHVIFYVSAAIYVLLKYKKTSVETERKKIRTLLLISFLFLYSVILYALHITFIIITSIYSSLFIDIIIYLDVLLLALLSIQFVNHPELYINSKKINNSYLDNSPFFRKKKSKIIQELTESEINKITEKLNELLQNELFFTNQKNNFKEFSNYIGVPEYKVRLYLKSENTSYIDLKNKVRLNIAKNLLTETKLTYSLDHIAEKSGFATRSNFFTIFKKYEKCSPREYVKS